MKEKVLIVLSGGQDSTTCLAWAVKNFGSLIYSISFNYGQRHQIELSCAIKLASLANSNHYEINLDFFPQLSPSALIGSEGNISLKHSIDKTLPASFVPGRNYFFLGAAACKAYSLGIHHIVTGVCQTDYSGYPDCRDNSIKSVQAALSSCLQYDLIIHTPLMWMTKAETILLMIDLGKLDWYKHTHTCYEGKRPPCGICPACKLRAKGFKEAGIKDPLL